MNLTFSPTYTGPQPGSPEQVHAIITELRRLYPNAACTLNFSNPLELLIATQLSAQCTDERVNVVTTQLFQKYRTVEDFATASQENLEQDIRPTGFYRNKTKNIRATCQRLITAYGGEVPHTMEDLLTLPGVARKTANVVLGNGFGIVVGFVVDTHVGRLRSAFRLDPADRCSQGRAGSHAYHSTAGLARPITPAHLSRSSHLQCTQATL